MATNVEFFGVFWRNQEIPVMMKRKISWRQILLRRISNELICGCDDIKYNKVDQEWYHSQGILQPLIQLRCISHDACCLICSMKERVSD